jgi:hypothetical protein
MASYKVEECRQRNEYEDDSDESNEDEETDDSDEEEDGAEQEEQEEQEEEESDDDSDDEYTPSPLTTQCQQQSRQWHPPLTLLAAKARGVIYRSHVVYRGRGV